MAIIQVQKTGFETYWVKVEATSMTTHTINLNDAYCEKLTGGQVSPETLIKKSFEFLLEHENNSTILSRFELSEIGQYFPQYEQDIVKRLKD